VRRQEQDLMLGMRCVLDRWFLGLSVLGCLFLLVELAVLGQRLSVQEVLLRLRHVWRGTPSVLVSEARVSLEAVV
jgi:hypothetical protein